MVGLEASLKWRKIKKARSNDLANLLTLGVRANTVSVRLAGLENEYWPLNQTSTLSVLLVGFFQSLAAQAIRIIPVHRRHCSSLNHARVASHLLPSRIFSINIILVVMTVPLEVADWPVQAP